MIGLENKTKGLRFCNRSGYVELYNDPEVSYTTVTANFSMIESRDGKKQELTFG